ncbi:Probable LIM domain-containing serine/threonine-protein kinase DDB [Seminavis robusta]|uniref:Probable LIM domain-containing serine/threonine-protein kinase DDB n=1 Tax=Seminavis robusta TaxID=568900 RepID=A0A9N8DA60_9STRA|nr:Probable LIM domain-containing serine/threonine-protein kinase DDB [Seminavis robusta]|eukprot:Sro30_g019870.1 Probable LIM domain-containing serine/threonine-protein kinase DDB (199) ;mRNA; r:144406-145176
MLLVERLIVAYDLASALAYMHENSLIYRDIKQENFGFDIRGDIKIFDFGLSKALSPTLLAKKSKTMYNLTPVTGSIPYMAPEVTLKLPYNCRCDCFSFALLFHEILALRKTPFHTYPPQEYFQRVVKGNERPTIRTSWPATNVLKNGWDFDPGKRPPMKSIASMIRSELYERSEQDSVLNRSMYMNDKSIRSLQGLDC